MIRKIAIMSTLIASLAYAEVEQKGFFVGVDYASKSVDLKYENTSTGFSYNAYNASPSDNTLSLKAGYQYYFTRVYARIAQYDYHDTSKNRYSIDGTTYELNADYLPVLYMAKDKKWDLRGFVGIGVGYNKSRLYNYNTGLLPVDPLTGNNQTYIEYGWQLGAMVETEIGVSVEVGMRGRKGDLLEFTDNTNEATFLYDTTEYYLGINYLF